MKTIEQVKSLAKFAYKDIEDATNKKEIKKRTDYWKWLKDIIEYLEMKPTEAFLREQKKKTRRL